MAAAYPIALEAENCVHESKQEVFRTPEASFMTRRFKRKVTVETEGTTTDTDGSRNDSDSDSTLEDLRSVYDSVPTLDIDSLSEVFPDDNAFDPSYRSPDLFDYMPTVRVPPAFSEEEISKMRTMEVQQHMATQAMRAMGMPPMGMPPMGMPPMPTGAKPMGMVSMPSAGPNASPSSVMVQVPVPMPMPFAMPNVMAPMPSGGAVPVPVPKGFKLVRIPGAEPKAEPAPAPAPVPKAAISDPAHTDHKIFVGGLNPITTSQTLREYFSQYGAVLDAKVIREGEKSKGFGFVQFKDSIPAEALEGSHIIDQRRCGVGPAFHRDSAQ